mmetsp:Transcript_3141/g.4577  ORF Transcript_3141/g.4577 Transcript_3141/m.4577 type:complete len:115 (-) Transcript_3141:1055-1399(-)
MEGDSHGTAVYAGEESSVLVQAKPVSQARFKGPTVQSGNLQGLLSGRGGNVPGIASVSVGTTHSVPRVSDFKEIAFVPQDADVFFLEFKVVRVSTASSHKSVEDSRVRLQEDSC